VVLGGGGHRGRGGPRPGAAVERAGVAHPVDGSPINPFPVQFYRGSADLGTRAGPSLLEGWSITSPSAVTPSTFGRGLR
jgi:hypothetical protein